MMRITFDPVKRAATLQERGLDFADAGAAFTGREATLNDERFDYGETRRIHGRISRWSHGYRSLDATR